MTSGAVRRFGRPEVPAVTGKYVYIKLFVNLPRTLTSTAFLCVRRSDQCRGAGLQCRGMFHHSLALERRSSKEKLENTQLRQSTLLEANLKLKADTSPLPHPDSSPVSTIATLPSEGDLQSVTSAKSVSLQGAFSETRPKSPSESFRRRQRHTSFADQQQQPLEHMCAPAPPRPTLAPSPHPTLAMRPAPPSRPR